MHLALYRKWRPVTFDEVYGQDHITKILKYEVANNKTTHAYLFSGSRGTGKTTCAKILAKAVNCYRPVNGNPCCGCEACIFIDNNTTTDFFEMDAASNTGVEYIRDIKDDVVYAPSVLKTRIYIIDEAHMLSISAFNALLKTLEEPPPDVLFILATTESQKIPPTVLSRCQRFEFRRISNSVLTERLKYIAEAENIKIDNDAALMIARLAQGGFRDAISLLELCSGDPQNNITSDTVIKIAGVTDREQISLIIRAVLEGGNKQIFDIISQIYSSSKDIGVFWSDLLNYYRDMLIIKSTSSPENYMELTESEFNDVKKTAERYDTEKLLYHCKIIDDTYSAMQQNNVSKRLCAEITLIRLTDDKYNVSYEALASRIAALENKSFKASNVNTEINSDGGRKDTVVIEEKSELKPTQLKAIQHWIEVIKKYEETDKIAASFLQKTKGFFCGGDIMIIAADNMAINMLDKETVKENIADIINYIENKNYKAGDIKYEIKQRDRSYDDTYINDLVDPY